ncbi:hypothetical protein DH2020_021468 [Rehmannia glutinosa]|uniref:AAA+ ATPase domain-containing protein n=1 Tax=Rehmannia glutinosa TaxID=99300 RepID=A0ABR0WCT7_REHGL
MDEPDNDGNTPVTKRRRRIDEEEEKSRLVEAQHSGVSNHSGGASSSVASACSSEVGDDSLSDDEASISVEKSEPDFDLLKTILRENLSQKSKKSGEKQTQREKSIKKSESREVKQVMEMEVVNNEDVKEEMVHVTNGEDRNRNGSEKIRKMMFSDFGGMDGVIKELIQKVIVPFHHPELPRNLRVKPITGILLHGPPGCGKTTLAEAIANETGVPFYKISAAALVSGVSGESEENIRELFSKAIRTAPSIVFIDEIDAIASKRTNLRGMEVRIVSQLLTCMDESRNLVKLVDDNAGSGSSCCRPGYVLVIGTTNSPDALDPALRRGGRFDCEFLLSVPDESARLQILSKLTCNIKAGGALDLVKLARSTPGFVGADLEALVDEAGNIAMNRIIGQRGVDLSKEQKDGACNELCWRAPMSDEEMANLIITMADFEASRTQSYSTLEAVKTAQPSGGREGFSDIPNVKWDDVGGLHLLRQEFDRHIIRPIKFPEVYKNHGANLEAGFLLYGPPGCGKTLIAKALANEAGANFIHIKGPELLSKYVGDSELAVRTIFGRARRYVTVHLLPQSSGSSYGFIRRGCIDNKACLHFQISTENGLYLPLQLLVELDGADHRKGIFVIGATNRPDAMDTALLRPNRLGKLLYVPLPSPDERGMILKALARNKLIDPNVDLMAIGKDRACENFSGADLSALINEATFTAIEEQSSNGSCSVQCFIKDAHFKKALEKISPSVSKKVILVTWFTNAFF